ncbi:MAG: flavodoxin domain-containing protein [Romboutsia sp.]
MNTAIVYGTNYGTSEKVAQILGEQINGAVELINIENITKANIDEIDILIIGCGIKIGKMPRNLSGWINKNIDKILQKELYIYMCAKEEQKEKINELFYINFPEELLSNSKFTTCVGGEVDFDKIGFLITLLFKLIYKNNKENINSLNFEKIREMAEKINTLEKIKG